MTNTSLSQCTMQVACKTGGAEQLEKEQKSADGDESDQQGGARRAVFNEEESGGETSMRLPIPQLVNVSEVSELLIGPGRQVQPGTACLL